MANPLLESLQITTLFESFKGDEVSIQLYRDVVLRRLKKILPSEFFDCSGTLEEIPRIQQSILKKTLPLITCSEAHDLPSTFSFFALSKYRPNSFKFFFEMISRWLTPGRRLNVVLVYATDFQLKQISEEVYTICEVMIQVDDPIVLEEIRRNFPIIGTEIALGIGSEFYAQRILEIKGLTSDDKIALIQGFISCLVKRFPKHFDRDVFSEMQHVLVTCRDDFKINRKARHLSRIISIQYLFRKGLRESLKKKAQRRYLQVKIFRSKIHAKGEEKRVLSILVGILIRDQENLGEKNLIQTIQHYIPNAQAIEDSFFMHKLSSENICFFYIEIEKREGNLFTSAEMKKLRKELPAKLKNRIEHRVHTLFMPRNEEEIMRNIVSLTNQIKYVRDIPQVFITFDEQVYSHLYFTVILARLLRPDSHSLSDLFNKSKNQAEYIHDRTKIVGHLRKKYPKEATVFRLKLSKENFLRADHSIDLYKARQVVVNELLQIMGEIRDYNGGIISKQHEILTQIRDLLVDVKEYDELLLEDFYYSFAPMIVRTLLNPLAFKNLFVILLEGLREYKIDVSYLKYQADTDNIYGLSIVEDASLNEGLHKKIQEISIPTGDLAFSSIKTHGYSCLGYICWCQDPEKREQFKQLFNQ